jgi:hypothetical protein
MGLFNVLVGVKEEGVTALELAEKTNSDEIFISEYFTQKKSVPLSNNGQSAS